MAPWDADLAIDVLAAGGVAVIDVRGDLDLTTAPRLMSTLREHAMGPVTRIELDCRGVEFLDSAGVRALIVGRNEAERAGVAFVLVNPSRAVQRVLDMTGLSSLMQLEPSH